MPTKYKNISSMVLNIDPDNRPFLQVQINDGKYIGLLDSGAQCSVMSKEMYEKMGKEKNQLFSCAIKITTASKQIVPVLGYVRVPYLVRKTKRIIPTLVIDNGSPLILGMDFWNAYGISPVFLNDNFDINEIQLDEIDRMEIDEKVLNQMDDITPPKPNLVSVPHELDHEQQSLLNSVVTHFPFVPEEGELNCTHLAKHVINTGDALPVRKKQYIMSPAITKKAIEEVNRLLKRGIIEPIKYSEWLLPFLPVQKPNGSIRLCLDARGLNAVTKRNAYPQQNMNRILGQLSSPRYISTLDMTDAFYQIPLAEESKCKTAFSVPSKGTFVFKRMVMGLCDSGSTLCWLIDKILGADFEPYCFPYMDDIVIVTDTFERHIEILGKIADRLKMANLTINPKKSLFCYKRLKYLGHIINEDGIGLDPSRIEAMLNFPEPSTIKEARRVLGMAGWYRKFVRNFAEISAPISETLKTSNGKFQWTNEASIAFKKLIKCLTEAPVLGTADYSLPFIIESDASDIGCGCVLIQIQGGKEKVIAYMSQKFTGAQRKYQTTEKECLAVILGFEKFRPYIEGSRVTVITDHAALLWLQNLKDPTGRLARWALRLQAYDFTIIHKKGKDHVVPDALSRSVEMVVVTNFKKTTDSWYTNLISKINENPQLIDDFEIKNGLLYKRVKVDPEEWRLCVPSEFRNAIIKDNHDEITSCHFGKFKTMHKIRLSYYWPAMRKDIENYIRNCEICKKVKPKNIETTPPMGEYIEPGCPWRIIASDIIGPFPLSKRGNMYILVAIDLFSKFTILKATKRATAESLVEFLKNEVFLKFSPPKYLIIDNGKQYKSKLFNELMKELGIKSWYTASYFPQANCTEAVNKTIGTAIRTFVINDFTHREWDVHLQEIASAINHSVHTSTQEIPSTVLFGQRMPQKGVEYDIIVDVQNPNTDPRSTFDLIRSKVAENLKKAYENNRKRYNLRTRAVDYSVGDIVYRENKKLSDASVYYSSKLAPRFIKSKILEKKGTNTYVLEDFDSKRTGIYHAEHFHK